MQIQNGLWKLLRIFVRQMLLNVWRKVFLTHCTRNRIRCEVRYCSALITDSSSFSASYRGRSECREILWRSETARHRKTQKLWLVLSVPAYVVVSAMLQGPAHRKRVAEQQKVPDEFPRWYSPASTHKIFWCNSSPVSNQMIRRSSSSFLVLAQFTVVDAGPRVFPESLQV
jgi:hypothetical protein